MFPYEERLLSRTAWSRSAPVFLVPPFATLAVAAAQMFASSSEFFLFLLKTTGPSSFASFSSVCVRFGFTLYSLNLFILPSNYGYVAACMHVLELKIILAVTDTTLWLCRRV
jgi:hypothetical protein